MPDADSVDAEVAPENAGNGEMVKKKRKRKRYRLKSPFQPSQAELKRRERAAAEKAAAAAANPEAATATDAMNTTTASSVASSEKPKKGGFFKRKASKDPNVSTDDVTSMASGDENKTPKKGLFSKMKFSSLVKGRKKKGDAASLYSQDEDYDPHNPPVDKIKPRTALDPDILAQVLENDPPPSNDKKFGRNGSSMGDDDEENSEDEDELGPMGRRKPKKDNKGGLPFEDEDEEFDKSDRSSATADSKSALIGPLHLVLLVVDPKTLRFELLQLEFATPHEATVGDVLEQIRRHMLQPHIKMSIQLAGDVIKLMDRKGNAYGAKATLAQAARYRKRKKDILVALTQGTPIAECSKLARPILGDDKVMNMLQKNGYDCGGWAKKELKLKDDQTIRQREVQLQKRKRFLVMAGSTVVGSLVLMLLMWIVYRLFIRRGEDNTTAVVHMLDVMGVDTTNASAAAASISHSITDSAASISHSITDSISDLLSGGATVDDETTTSPLMDGESNAVETS